MNCMSFEHFSSPSYRISCRLASSRCFNVIYRINISSIIFGPMVFHHRRNSDPMDFSWFFEISTCNVLHDFVLCAPSRRKVLWSIFSFGCSFLDRFPFICLGNAPAELYREIFITPTKTQMLQISASAKASLCLRNLAFWKIGCERQLCEDILLPKWLTNTSSEPLRRERAL